MSDRYKLHGGSGEAPIECDSCGVATETVKTEKPPGSHYPNGPRDQYMCSLCYTTLIGNAHNYPNQYPAVTPEMLAQAVHWLKGQIIKELKNGR